MTDKGRKYLLANKDGLLSRVSVHVVDYINNELSHGNIHNLLSTLLRMNNDELWIDEVFDDFFIYVDNGKLLKRNYTADLNSVTFEGDPVGVTREVSFVEIESDNVFNTRKGKKMDKVKIVDALIANKSTQWTEDNKDALMKLEEDVLAKMEPVANADADKADAGDGNADADKADAGDGNADADKADAGDGADTVEENMSTEDFINKAPPEIQAVLNSGLASYKASKEALIKVITANERNKFTKDQLAEKDVEELKSLASLAANTEKEKENLEAINNNYDGQGDPAANAETEEPLEVPTMNFEEKK